MADLRDPMQPPEMPYADPNARLPSLALWALAALALAAALLAFGCEKPATQIAALAAPDPDAEFRSRMLAFTEEGKSVARLLEEYPDTRVLKKKTEAMTDLLSRIPDAPARYAQLPKVAKDVLLQFEIGLLELKLVDESRHATAHENQESLARIKQIGKTQKARLVQIDAILKQPR